MCRQVSDNAKWTQAVGRSAAIREDTSEPLAAEVVGVGTGAEVRK